MANYEEWDISALYTNISHSPLFALMLCMFHLHASRFHNFTCHLLINCLMLLLSFGCTYVDKLHRHPHFSLQSFTHPRNSLYSSSHFTICKFSFRIFTAITNTISAHVVVLKSKQSRAGVKLMLCAIIISTPTSQVHFSIFFVSYLSSQ